MGADGFLGVEQLGEWRRTAPSEPAPDTERAERAANGFARSHPEHSARLPVSRAQARTFAAGMGIVAAAWLIFPQALHLLVTSVLVSSFALILGWRLWLVFSALVRRPRQTAPLSRREPLPIYTILIALKDEAASMPALSASMAALDYPADRLDLKLLIETGDASTHEAILAQDWPPGTELLVLPPGDPRTKPRALNYGLAQARGAYVVVYDAEDRPDPTQLRVAARAFETGPPQLACVQAPLIGVNTEASWLAGQWALEYAIQFGHVLPSLSRMKLPIALGGTSNHIKRDALVRAGGWDAWNVTEDADLGLRFARLGLQVDTITPPTYEKPPQRLRVWIAQRSRWLKGFAQTWLVLMRQPRRALREMGLSGFLSMQLTLGGALLSAMAHGPWALWCLACLIFPQFELGWLSGTALVVSYLCGVAIAFVAPGPMGRERWRLVATLPFYWPLQSIAMARAIFGMYRCPHFWAKTPHN